MGHDQLLIERGGFLFLLVNEVVEHLFVLQVEGEVVLLVDAETVPSLEEVHSRVPQFSEQHQQLTVLLRLLVFHHPVHTRRVVVSSHQVTTAALALHHLHEHFLQVELHSLLDAVNQLVGQSRELLIIKLECPDVPNVPLLLHPHFAQQFLSQLLHLGVPLLIVLLLVLLEVGGEVDEGLVGEECLEDIDDFALLAVSAVVSHEEVVECLGVEVSGQRVGHVGEVVVQHPHQFRHVLLHLLGPVLQVQHQLHVEVLGYVHKAGPSQQIVHLHNVHEKGEDFQQACLSLGDHFQLFVLDLLVDIEVDQVRTEEREDGEEFEVGTLIHVQDVVDDLVALVVQHYLGLVV